MKILGALQLNDTKTGFSYKLYPDRRWTAWTREFLIRHNEKKNETKVTYNLMSGGRAPSYEEVMMASVRALELFKEYKFE